MCVKVSELEKVYGRKFLRESMIEKGSCERERERNFIEM